MMASQSSAFGTFLDTYDRLTSSKKQTPGDATASILKRLIDRQGMTLTDLISTSGIDVGDIESAIVKLEKLDAIKLTGFGLQQRIEVTPKANELLELFK